jgi:DNA-binding cell septation regulator SpoVG
MEIAHPKRKKSCPRITRMNANKNRLPNFSATILCEKKIFAAIRVIRGQKILFLAVGNYRAAQ